MSNNDILILLAYIAGGFVLGIIIHKWLMPLLGRVTQKTKMKSDDLIIATVSKWMVPSLVVLGLYLGLERVDMSDKYYTILTRSILIFYIVAATIIAATVASGLLSIKSKDENAVLPSSSIISKIAKVMVYIVGLILILQSQGISVTGILTTLGVGGLAVALALQNTLANLFAGLQIIGSGKFNTGDFIRLTTGEEGNIEDISWRSTTIKAVDNHVIIVPNGKLADMIVHNYVLPTNQLTFNLAFGVGYESDLKHVERVTIEVVKEILNEMEGGVKDFEPFTRYYAFDESSIGIKAFLRVKSYSDQFIVRHEFIKKLHERFIAEGIKIPFPIRTVVMQPAAITEDAPQSPKGGS